MENLQLEVWQGDWGLPSVDAQCLSVMAYCKFSRVEMKIVKGNNPWRSPTGELPVLRHDQGSETKVTDIFNYLRKQSCGTDADLSSKQSADVVAFSSLLEEKLLPAILHLWWVDSKTYAEFTRPWYSKVLPFPLSLFVPAKKHKEYENRLYRTKGGESMNGNEREAKIYKEAKECLNLLSAKLGDKDYFMGNMPCSLDALVFGYVAPLLKAPFPNSTLQNHLKGCDNLTQFCQRVLLRFFPLSAEEREAQEKKEEEDKKRQAESVDFPNKRRNMMVGGMVALTAMVGYAFLSGLVQVEITDVDEKNGNSSQKEIKSTSDMKQFDNLFQQQEEANGNQREQEQE